jgi:membrane associated rhomboid family serine protease
MFVKDNAPGYEYAWVNYACCGLVMAGLLAGNAYPTGAEGLIADYAPTAARVFHGASLSGGQPGWLSLVLAPFLVSNWVTGLLSLMVLWQFGDNIEYICGRPRYVLFYIAAGVAGVLLQLVFTSGGDVPVTGGHAAAAATALAYLICFPRARLTMLVYIRPYSLDHALAGDWGYNLRNISAFWYIASLFGTGLLWSFLIVSVHAYADSWCIQYFLGTLAGGLAGFALLFPLELPGRRPGRDAATSSDELTLPYLGDEGDYGDGEVRGAPSLGAEVARLRRGSAGERHRLMLAAQDHFEDRYADGMIERGELHEAYLHCHDMLGLAQRASDDRRIRGYRRLLSRLEGLHQQQQALLTVRRSAPHEDHPDSVRWQAAIDAAHGDGTPADPHGFSGTPRGTRRR